MPFRDPPTKYPIIDSDPHVGRVIRYFRKSDYGFWALGSVVFPVGVFFSLNLINPVRGRASILGLSTFYGFSGGFLYAYQRSSMRLWGWEENSREVELDWQDRQRAAAAGVEPFGESSLPPYLQSVAARHTRYGSLLFGLMPIVNFTHHNLGVNWDLHRERERALLQERGEE